MTVAAEKKTVQGRCIMVGLQMDRRGRELLDSAIRIVANEGDRVVAAHVSRASALCSASDRSAIAALDPFLSAYRGLCNLSRVVLVGRVSRGSSVGKTLVKDVEKCGAAAVVVGLNRHCYFGPTSVAKYCATHLRPTTALVAVQNGRVVFERVPAKPPTGQEPKPSIRSLLHPSVGMDTDGIIPIGEVRDSTEFGWPLLRRAIRASAEPLKETGAGKISVVEWAMNLPDRSPSSVSSTPTTDQIKDMTLILRKNSSSCKWFRHDELRSSTNQFSSEKLIGKGGSSQVYKGRLSDGQVVAIKSSKLSKDASEGLFTEVDIVVTLRHERIVPLLGICVEKRDFLSIYDYFPIGSLEENIHGKRSKSPLSWETRFKVAVGVAEGLNYLHCGISRSVIHRDIKSSNILLTEEFEPKIDDTSALNSSDIRFRTSYMGANGFILRDTNDVVGTFGYLAPEYFMYGKLSNKIDVYAYGVVLLELLTGRKPISEESLKGQQSLVVWATRILERGDPKEILDSDLDGNYDEGQMRRLVVTATLCIRRSARLRPEMSQVLGLLKGEDGIDSWIALESNNSFEDQDYQDDEAYPISSVGSHLGLALLDVEEDDASTISFEQNHLSSLDDYLRERWSRSPSFN